MPDSYLVACLPRVLQGDVNANGDPKTAIVVIRTNNGRLDECIKLHANLVNYILKGSDMPDDSKPDKPKEQQQQTQEQEVK